jgi:voltage-gated potassium channel
VLGIFGIQFVIVYGVLGYVVLGWDPFDAFYQVVITISGVGLTEVHPMETIAERLHTMGVIGLGLLSVAFTLGGFVQFLAEGEFQRYFGEQRMFRQIDRLSGHTVVAGYGRVGETVCEGLTAVGSPFVVIELSPDKITTFESLGYLYVLGDATEEKVLREAGITRARALITVMPNDAENVFITLTARELSKNLDIIARAEQSSTPKKLRQAGANHVVMPAAIGAHRIVSLLTNPTAVEFVELVTQRSRLAIEMDDIPIKAESRLIGRTLRDADIGRRTGVIVVAIKRADGHVEFPPQGDEMLNSGDSIVILGRRDHINEFRNQYT